MPDCKLLPNVNVQIKERRDERREVRGPPKGGRWEDGEEGKRAGVSKEWTGENTGANEDNQSPEPVNLCCVHTHGQGG